jgi:hypothetical protein
MGLSVVQPLQEGIKSQVVSRPHTGVGAREDMAGSLRREAAAWAAGSRPQVPFKQHGTDRRVTGHKFRGPHPEQGRKASQRVPNGRPINQVKGVRRKKARARKILPGSHTTKRERDDRVGVGSDLGRAKGTGPGLAAQGRDR